MLSLTVSTPDPVKTGPAQGTVKLTFVEKSDKRAHASVTSEIQHQKSITESDKQFVHYADMGAVSSRHVSKTSVIPSSPVEFRFADQKLGLGLRSAVGVVFGVGAGAFMATHVPTSQPLHFEVATVATVFTVLGLCLIPLTVRALWGKLRIDSQGIRLSPRIFGFAVRWKDLEHWSVEGIHFHVHTRKANGPQILDLGYLAPDDRRRLRDVMKSCVPELEGRSTRMTKRQLP